MAATSPAAFTGLLGAFRALGDGLLQTLEKRLKLAALELQEEKLNLVQTMLWLGTIFVTGLLALAFISISVVYLCEERSRVGALLAVAGFHTATLLVLLLAFRRYLRRQSPPFAAMIEELGKDRACIRKTS